MNKILGVVAVSALLLAGTAYADGAAQPAASSSSGVVGTPAPGSKFSKIQVGMHSREVTDLIGQPNDQKGYQTGKAFIPFHFGGDNYRMEYHYKGEGTLTFSGGGIGDTSLKLIRINVDPSESGYVR